METLDWAPVHDGWAWLIWKVPGDKRITAYKELKRIEQELKAQGFRGWLVDSGHEFKQMHHLLQRLGARIYSRDERSYFFVKEIL